MAAKRKTNSRTRKKKTKNYYSTYVIADAIITILLAVFMYIDSGEGGYVKMLVKNVFCGLWGPVGYFIPVVTGGLLVYLVKYRDTNRFWNKLVLLLLAMVNVSAIINLSADTGISDAYYWGSIYCVGGGFLGACVSVFMEKMVQKIASYIILSFTLIILASFIANVSIFSAAAKYIRVMFLGARDKYEDLRDVYAEKKEQRIHEEEYEEYADESNSALEAANSFALDNEPKKKKSAKKDEKKKKPQTEDVSVLDLDFSDGIDEVFGKIDNPADKSTEKPADIPSDKLQETADKPAEEKGSAAKEKVSKITDAEKNEFHQELNEAIEKQHIEYVYPTINLLNKPKTVSGDQRDEMRKTAEKLIAVLDDFGVKAKLLQVTQGPTVTRYEIQPDTGIKLSKIVGLADDIALNLAVSTVLIAPVPGKAAVGDRKSVV